MTLTVLNFNKLGIVYTSHHSNDGNATENKTTQQTCGEVQLFVTSPSVQSVVSTGFTDCLPDSHLMKTRPVVLKIYHVNRQRATAKSVRNPRQIIAESLPTGQVGRQGTSCIGNGGPEVAAVRLVDRNRFLVSINIHLSRWTELLCLTYLYKEVPTPR